MSRFLVAVLLPPLTLLDGTASLQAATVSTAQVSDTVVSFLGEPLPSPPFSESRRIDLEAKLATARADSEADPSDIEATIWLGRRLAYLGRYTEAIEVFSAGIDRHPAEPRLYRHRGHRFITTRQLAKAIEDLETAAGLIEGLPDQVEPDGLPNERGIPTSTLQSNIWYHLGLARYLKGDFSAALEAYEACIKVSRNPDMRVATSHWLYMTLRRLDLTQRAEEILVPITADLDVIENHEYQQLLLMYKGELEEGEIWPPSGDGVTSATLGYGFGNWHLYNGRAAKADTIFRLVLEGDQWAAFGYLAAEAEIARSQGKI